MGNDQVLQNLADEVERLTRENAFLRKKLEEFGYVNNTGIIRTAEEKIRIFRSYFCGRKDIYATRFLSKKTGRKGYSFVCQNRFDAQCCQIAMKTGSCHGCSFHQPAPLTDEVVRRHFPNLIMSIQLQFIHCCLTTPAIFWRLILMMITGLSQCFLYITYAFLKKSNH